MAKRSVTFRFSEETLRLLGAVAVAEGRTRTQVLEELVRGAGGGLGFPSTEPDQKRAVRKPAGPDRDKLAAFAQQNMGRGKR